LERHSPDEWRFGGRQSADWRSWGEGMLYTTKPKRLLNLTVLVGGDLTQKVILGHSGPLHKPAGRASESLILSNYIVISSLK
jgi:hypothetical protein